jgi:NAD-dependent dihydropyrimidine dehydrogenase PreA subunit
MLKKGACRRGRPDTHDGVRMVPLVWGARVIYHLYYFSATGNTWRAVGRISDVLGGAGHTVRMVSINRWSEPLSETPDRMLVAFPALGFAPPALVTRFLRKLPRQSVRTAVFTADAGGAFDAPLRAARVLRRRGYDIFLTGTGSYSENWLQVSSGPDPDTKVRNTARGDDMTDRFAQRLVSDESHCEPGNRLLLLLARGLGSLFVLAGRRFLGKMFVADDRCNSCGLCETRCPVGAIVMTSGRKPRPAWRLNCESCNRCVNICPTTAINSSIVRTVVMLLSITLACVFGLRAYFRLVAPLIAGSAGVATTVVNIAAVVIIVGLSHWVSLGPLDWLMLAPLGRLPVVGRLFDWSFTGKFIRYRMDGYKPPSEHGRAADSTESDQSLGET